MILISSRTTTLSHTLPHIPSLVSHHAAVPPPLLLLMPLSFVPVELGVFRSSSTYNLEKKLTFMTQLRCCAITLENSQSLRVGPVVVSLTLYSQLTPQLHSSFTSSIFQPH